MIVFDPLDQEQIKMIVRQQAKRVECRLEDKKIRLVLTEPAVDYLAREGYDPGGCDAGLTTAIMSCLQSIHVVNMDDCCVVAGSWAARRYIRPSGFNWRTVPAGGERVAFPCIKYCLASSMLGVRSCCWTTELASAIAVAPLIIH